MDFWVTFIKEKKNKRKKNPQKMSLKNETVNMCCLFIFLPHTSISIYHKKQILLNNKRPQNDHSGDKENKSTFLVKAVAS